MRKINFVRATAASLGGLLLASVAGMAFAEDEYGTGDVDVLVEIEALTEPGTLAMSVAADSVTLTESGSTALVRQFTGVMPTVTVLDTRDPADIPAGVGWYVLGTATDFEGDAGQPDIGAGHLGWKPQLIDGGDLGLVAEGDQVDTVMDSGPDAVGLVDQELLALALDSALIAEEGQWTATADLFLKTEASVAPGNYASVLTLSLFE